jgi:imidazolonepropionase-like amidohydrolase
LDEELARRIADRGTWLNPTVHIGRTRIWRFERLSRERQLSEAETAEFGLVKDRYAVRCEHMSRLIQLGVRMAAGSDCGWSYYAFGGFRHEIEALASCGLGAAAALRAGTLDSATAMGLDREVGSVERGKLADLLVVAGDPLVDLHALGNIDAVFLGGTRVR